MILAPPGVYPTISVRCCVMEKAAVEKSAEKSIEKKDKEDHKVTEIARARKDRTLELLQRALGLRHKLKVHDTMPRPETHEEIAVNTWARWELEDELNAIEELLKEVRLKNMAEKKTVIEKKGPKKKQKVD